MDVAFTTHCHLAPMLKKE